MTSHPPRIAVLVPCYNEGLTVANVVRDFAAALPGATIYVYDNNSSDNTAEAARAAGAVVRHETRQGKGFVVQRMFADVEADVYVLVDGDGTYDASAAPKLVTRLLADQLDFVNGARREVNVEAYRPGHRFGNRLLTGLVQNFFGRQFEDMLSGYKALSRRFVKSFPAMARGFETETELLIHALRLLMPSAEIVTDYRERPAGSQSKLRTYRDGTLIMMMIARLVKDERPLMFFGWIGYFTAAIGVLLGIPVVIHFIETGLVPRFPTAILSVSLVIIGLLAFFVGLILDMVTRTRQEMKRLAYLAVPMFDGDTSQNKP